MEVVKYLSSRPWGPFLRLAVVVSGRRSCGCRDVASRRNKSEWIFNLGTKTVCDVGVWLGIRMSGARLTALGMERNAAAFCRIY